MDVSSSTLAIRKIEMKENVGGNRKLACKNPPFRVCRILRVDCYPFCSCIWCISVRLLIFFLFVFAFAFAVNWRSDLQWPRRPSVCFFLFFFPVWHVIMHLWYYRIYNFEVFKWTIGRCGKSFRMVEEVSINNLWIKWFIFFTRIGV